MSLSRAGFLKALFASAFVSSIPFSNGEQYDDFADIEPMVDAFAKEIQKVIDEGIVRAYIKQVPEAEGQLKMNWLKLYGEELV